MHIVTGAGVWMAEFGSATEGNIRHIEKWNSQTLAGCYLTSLHWPALRTVSGFPSERGYFDIK